MQKSSDEFFRFMLFHLKILQAVPHFLHRNKSLTETRRRYYSAFSTTKFSIKIAKSCSTLVIAFFRLWQQMRDFLGKIANFSAFYHTHYSSEYWIRGDLQLSPLAILSIVFPIWLLLPAICYKNNLLWVLDNSEVHVYSGISLKRTSSGPVGSVRFMKIPAL